MNINQQGNINQIINSSNNRQSIGQGNHHVINQNYLRKDILGIYTDRQNITPVKLIDNNKRILNNNINVNNHVNDIFSFRKNMNSNLNNIDRNVYMNIKLNTSSSNKPIYINPYNK
jgi:hypothetical protein